MIVTDKFGSFTVYAHIWYIFWISMIPVHNWRAPWKNRICSTTVKLRKSLVKPVMRQKTCNYNELFGSSTRDRHAGRIQCYCLNVRRYMHRYRFFHFHGSFATTPLLVCWWLHFHWSFARLIVPVLTTTIIILAPIKSQILVIAYTGCEGKWPLNKCYWCYIRCPNHS